MQPAPAREIVRKTRRISGWFSADAALLFASIDEIQRDVGVEGDLFEIGVHHGKSSVLLAAIGAPSERLAVCDLFGSQGANVSGSGSGDRAIFETNLRDLAGCVPDIFERSSGDLTAAELGGPFRFFHVDGGHLAAEALGDLRLGAETLAPGGVLVLDDPFRPEWPGVTEAAISFLAESDGFAPLVLGFNKLVLVERSRKKDYDARLAAMSDSYFNPCVYLQKILPIAGVPTRIFYIPQARQLPGLAKPIALARYAITDARRFLGASRRRVHRVSAGDLPR